MDDYSRVEEKMQKLLMKMTAINCILNQATRSINCIPIQQTTQHDRGNTIKPCCLQAAGSRAERIERAEEYFRLQGCPEDTP